MTPPNYINQLLATGKTVRLVVHGSACKGLELAAPSSPMGEVYLDIGYNMVAPIPDLMVDDTGIRCTLRFGTTHRLVIVPWCALIAAGLMPEPDAPRPKGSISVKLNGVTHTTKAAAALEVGSEKRAKRPLPKGWAVHKGGKA